MALFRPSNLNKRAYPGNAKVVGPTCATTLGINTTTSISKISSCATCSNDVNILGCRCTFCGCLCCCSSCSCDVTTCTPSVPSGIWKSSEQYEASTRNAWSGIVTSCSSPTFVGATAYGCVSAGAVAQIDCRGFFVCCDTTNGNKWFVSPSASEVCRNFYGIFNQSNATNLAITCWGNCGWFLPSCGQASNPGYICRSFWDTYQSSLYWTGTFASQFGPNVNICMTNGNFYCCLNRQGYAGNSGWARAFRCTAS